MSRPSGFTVRLPVLACILAAWAFLCPPGTAWSYTSPVTEDISSFINSGDMGGARKRARSYLDQDPRNYEKAKELDCEPWARILVARVAAARFHDRYEPQLDYADLLTGQRNPSMPPCAGTRSRL
ncbi:MAG: hypothetical protein P1S46_03880 [bacterium]|nr:hypothetical protein [bacterium]